MSKFKKLICLLITTLLLFTFSVCVSASNETSDSNIKIEVATDKAEYNATSVAQITATITNVSDKDIENVTAQVVFGDLSPAGKKNSQIKKTVETLEAGESFSFTYKATLDKNEHDLNIFQKIILFFVRLFNGGYDTNNNNIEFVAENITEIKFGKFTAENVIQVGYEAVNSDNDTNNQDNWNWGVDTAHVVSTDEYGNGYVDNLILIQFETTDKNIIDMVIDSINGTVIGFSDYEYQVQIEPQSLDKIKEICLTVSKMNGVWIAWPYYTMRYVEESVPNDPWKDEWFTSTDWDEENPNGLNWWLETIEASSAWEYNNRFSNIKIGVADKGFDTLHEDLQITVLNNNQNSFENHGTHVAGIIGATANNNTGITGIVWNKELYGVDIEESNEQSEYISMPDAFLGMEMLLEKGCKVINLSWGGLTDDNFDAIYEWGSYTANKILLWQEKMQRDDFIIVDSAGNKASDSIRGMYFCSITDEVLEEFFNTYTDELNDYSYEDVYNHFIVVGAVEKTSSGYQMTDFSNYGSNVSITAPGRDVYSTIAGIEDKDYNISSGQKYASLPGTSMAAPIVTGVTSLVWSVNPDFSAKEVKNIVCSSYNKTADPYHYPTDVKVYPIVNAKLAVEEAIWRTDNIGTTTGRFVDIKTGETVKNVTMECIRYTGDLSNYSLSDFNINAIDGTFNCTMYEGAYEYKIHANDYVQERNIILNIETGKCYEKGNINLIPTNSGDDNTGDSGEDERPITASGECGADGSNVTWTLYEDGELVISGSGEMEDFSSPSDVPWYANRDYITKVVIEDGVIFIGSYAFYNCTSLVDIIISNSVKRIGDNAFRMCTKISSVTIPDSVTHIGVGAFADSDNLTSITIPDSVTRIGNSAFGWCYSLTSVYISDISAWCNIYFSNSSSNPLSYDANLYLNNELVTELIIPDDVTSINDCAFSGCESLTSIIIPNSVKSIGDDAFRGCTNLTNVTIPDSVTSIGDGAFKNCTNLTNVTIPDSVRDIGSYAFYNCKSLVDIIIPNCVTHIGFETFYGCSSLTSVTIPDGVTYIGDDVFHGCTNLTNVTIPDSVTYIGDNAFRACTNLTNVTIPDSVTIINDYTFSGCSSLTSINIPDSVTCIDFCAFSACSSLTDVYYTGTQEQWEAIAIGSYNENLTNATIHYNS